MYRKLHHIGIGVRNLDHTVRFCQEVLGLKLEKRMDWSNIGLKGALFPMGEVKLELIEVLDAKDEITRSLAEAIRMKDGIVHHLCFSVDHVEETVKALMTRGVKIINGKPQKRGAGQIAWLDKNTIDGFMIELCEEGFEIK